MKGRTDKEKGKGKRVVRGVVVSDRMKDTAVVSVTRLVKHPRYGKYIRVAKKVKAHDPGNTHAVGAEVTLAACRPISKGKHFRILTSERSK